MNDDQLAHLAGLVDGAGSITVRIAKQDSVSLGYLPTPSVTIRRPEYDGPTLGKLDAYGEDYQIQYHINQESSSTQKFEVTNRDSIKRFLEPILPWLITKYEPALLMLEEVIPRLKDDRHLEKDGFYELVGFADQLRSVSRTGRTEKYTQEYFREKWDLGT